MLIYRYWFMDWCPSQLSSEDHAQHKLTAGCRIVTRPFFLSARVGSGHKTSVLYSYTHAELIQQFIFWQSVTY